MHRAIAQVQTLAALALVHFTRKLELNLLPVRHLATWEAPCFPLLPTFPGDFLLPEQFVLRRSLIVRSGLGGCCSTRWEKKSHVNVVDRRERNRQTDEVMI